MANKTRKSHKSKLAQYDKIKSMYGPSEGRWITVNGKHKFIKDDKKKDTSKKKGV